MGRLAGVMFVLALLGVSPVASGMTDARAPEKAKAIATVRALLKVNARPCGYRIGTVTAAATGGGLRVTAVTTGRTTGTSRWVIVAGKARPLNALAKRIRAACPRPSTPPPPPPPPPSPPPVPPLGGPGASATYVFGPEVSSSMQESVRRGLDIGARYYRALLGRELPPFAVWAYNDLNAIVDAYARNEPGWSAEAARRLWEGGQVAHATPRKLWFGPNYFVGRPDAAVSFFGSLQIAAHEAFHLFQYELVGDARKLGASDPDQIPVAGPWWLAEGAPTYFAQLAIVREGLLRLSDLQGQWRQSARAISAPLSGLMTFRGQLSYGLNAYHTYTLATELLLRDRDPGLVFAYYGRIGMGVAWPEAFSSTFGRTHDAFVAEFEAYRRTP